MPDTGEAAYVPICGVGASAGGVKALQALFRELPVDLGIAYVVVLHLSPDHPSQMSEILATVTSMPVHQVTDTPELHANCVYVIAPDRELVIEGDNVHARPFTQPRGRRAPIDMLFRSIAQGRGDGLAVVLTGAGSDGALGLGAIKEAGGVVLVQDPAEAEFPSMPNSAVTTGLADFVAPIPRLAELIAEIARSKEAVRSLDEAGTANDLRRVVGILHSRTGHDFSGYKRATVSRRVLRRMQVRHVLSLTDYARLLQESPEEASELYRDMLISVTQFFRDPAAFESLAEDVIAPLLADVSMDGIRVWVPGCATGEEAYSIAMLIAEAAARRQLTPRVQIFATDLDEGALNVARQGVYPGAIEADLSEERIQRFFIAEGARYRIRKEIRDMVLFATHSVLKDPPFLRLDLISCRNLLIYLERQLQEKLCSLFNFGLQPERYLFLGSAETADAAQQLFMPLNRQARIYRSLAHGLRALPVIAEPGGHSPSAALPLAGSAGGERLSEQPLVRHQAALEQAAPPSVLVDGTHRILHMSPGAGRYILHSGGTFSGRLSMVVRPELRLDLSHAIDRAISRKLPTLTLGAAVNIDNQTHRIAMNVVPIAGDNSASQALVVFLDGGPDADDDDAAPGENVSADAGRLRSELKSAKEALAVSRGEHDLAMQELRAANEELQSINEEYRSTAEELETSREELQSMNEELHTVNAELKKKLENISSAHSDLRNLTAATEIGTLFLDRQLQIRMFTPPIAELFNIKDSDIGRPLTNFTHRLQHNSVDAEIRRVLDQLMPLEAEIATTDGRWLMMRVRPYRTIEDRIDGAVVSFVDMTSLRGAEKRELESEMRYRLLFDSIDQGFCVIEILMGEDGRPEDYRFIAVNRAFSGQTGIADAVGRRMRDLAPSLEDNWVENYARVAATQTPEHFEGPAAALDRYFEAYAFPFGDPKNNQVGVLFQEITERRRTESERDMLTSELSHRVKNTLAVVQGLASQTGRNARSVEDFRASFIGRLHALAKAHDLLLATQWSSADIKRLVETSLDAYDAAGGDVISISGPAIDLSPKQGLGLSLILHELSTNAAKYGALSTPEGRLAVQWSQENMGGSREVVLCWEERGGPPVTAPQARGFGTKLIERASRFELGGEAELRFEPDGCTMHLRFPLA